MNRTEAEQIANAVPCLKCGVLPPWHQTEPGLMRHKGHGYIPTPRQPDDRERDFGKPR